MKNRISTFIVFGLLCLLTESTYAGMVEYVIKKDTTWGVTIYFDLYAQQVDSKYPGNNKALSLIDSLFTNLENVEYLDSITLASPAMKNRRADYNIRLARERSEAVKAFLQRRYPNINVSKIRTDERIEFWSVLRKLIIADPAVPGQEEVVALMDYHQLNPLKLHTSLQQLDAGIPYRYISERLLPKMRRTDITISLSYLPEAIETEPITEPLPTLAKETEKSIAPMVTEVIAPVNEKETDEEAVLALKNNLLYDLVLAPNIEVEIPLGKRWSVNAEYKCPWWSNNSKEFCYQLLSGGIEGRYWLGNRKTRSRLTGHFLGMYAEGGIYDFQFKGDGYQGEYYAAGGLTYGYSLRVARQLAFEFSLGIGYLTTEYQKYTPYEGSLVWMSTGRYNFIGPTKAKISLVWLITKGRAKR